MARGTNKTQISRCTIIGTLAIRGGSLDEFKMTENWPLSVSRMWSSDWSVDLNGLKEE